MKVLTLLLITLCLTTLTVSASPQFSSGSQEVQTGASGGQPAPASAPTAATGNTGNVTAAERAADEALKRDLAAQGSELSTALAAHGGRFQAFLATESNLFMSEMANQVTRLGQAIRHQFELMGAIAAARMEQEWRSVPTRLAELRDQAAQQLGVMQSKASDEMNQLKQRMAARQKPQPESQQ